jgi:hypothetical protein
VLKSSRTLKILVQRKFQFVCCLCSDSVECLPICATGDCVGAVVLVDEPNSAGVGEREPDSVGAGERESKRVGVGMGVSSWDGDGTCSHVGR